MSESIRPDKEDRYISESSPKKTQLSGFLLSKTKWIILILALCVLLLCISVAIFKSQSQSPQAPEQSDSTELGLSEDNQTSTYQTLSPAPISTTATVTQRNSDPEQERIVIPGDITDVLTNEAQSDELKQKNTLLLKGQNDSTNNLVNEQRLQNAIDNTHFTIQLSSSSSLENLMAFVKQYKLTNYQIYETRREQKPWFVLIKGSYLTLDDAKQAVKSLPQELQKSNPWIKSGEMVNKEKLSK